MNLTNIKALPVDWLEKEIAKYPNAKKMALKEHDYELYQRLLGQERALQLVQSQLKPIEGLVEAMKDIAEWNKKYPLGTTYNYNELEWMRKELVESVKKLQQFMEGEFEI